MDHKTKQRTYNTILSICFTFILFICITGMLVGCTTGGSKANLKNSVSYDGIDYFIQENIGLNFDGFHDFNKDLVNCVKK